MEISKVINYTYRGVTCSQHENVGEPFKLLFSSIKPSRILEIGTGWGSLTLLMNDVLISCGLQDVNILGYDVVQLDHIHLRHLNNIDFRLFDIFSDDRKTLKDMSVVDYIRSDGPTIVVCDGGFKSIEFNILSDYLKIGDIIMAHDYSPSFEYFEQNMKNKIWNWVEITDNDISDSVRKNNLEPFLQDDFIKVAWVCKIKK